MKVLTTFLVWVILFTTSVNAQLADFNLQVNKTDETCSGNGSLTFLVSNTTPNSAMLYKVYLLPDTNNPIAILQENTLTSLSAGSYRVIAMQSLGDELNTQSKDIIIEKNIQPFSFEIAAEGQGCSGSGTIIVNVLEGTAASYEIISGPVQRPLQPSNIFAGLPSGSYNIRAFNTCGAGKVKTFNLSVVNSQLSISDATYAEGGTDCDSITINNTITPTGGQINYPLTVRHTLSPMTLGGNEIVLNQIIPSGAPDSVVLTAVLPRLEEPYDYDITVVDNCSNTYQREGNVLDPDLELGLSTGDAPCAQKYIVINTSKFTTSYTVAVTGHPEGFDPSLYDISGTFTQPAVNFGSQTNPLPFGTYVIQVTDSCGRTASESINVEFIPLVPVVTAANNGCFSEFGKIRISIPQQMLVAAKIIGAPSSYGQTLPYDVTNKINAQGMLVLNNLPLGEYTIVFTDDCGFEYEKKILVPEYVEKQFNIASLPACGEGYGSVRVRSGNGKIVAAQIVATSALGFSLPYDVTNMISTQGHVYMAGLPEGTYTFRATDVCGVVKDQVVNIEGYRPVENSFSFTPNCGGFSVTVSDTSNGTEGAGYWLQKFNTNTGTWGHPSTGVAYTEGTVPASANSIRLNNSATRHNLNYSGKFRIVKKFETFSNGSAENAICLSVLGEFEYTEGFSINSAYSLACLGQPENVMLDVTGYPTAFRIVKKDNVPFLVDNGSSNVFENLMPAEYVFEIEDDCGNIVRKRFNVLSLPSIADATAPGDMIICTEPGTVQNHEFHLTDQNPNILGPLHSSMYTITYHLTQADADNDVNSLPEYYTNISNGQQIFARVVHNEIAICHAVTSFRLFIGEYQEPEITTEGTICDGGRLQLTAEAGFATYEWSTGETTRSIFVTEPGNYTVIVGKAYGDKLCEGFSEIEVKASFTPSIRSIETKDWTRDQNEIAIYTDEPGEYLYSIDGTNYQEEPVFTGLETGLYTVHVKDAAGCGEITKKVVLMYYPNFFTPNGDGVHDKWRIPYSIMEPNMKVTIFDRYGKLITQFGPNYEGWDGTLNGLQLPSTDYWFVVNREDGRELRGHFAMLR
ncbi:T9SS type B sorting domain-containing protein [Flavobacterium sp. MFBS3-15]|uniref:T9SS type B sorting domain-containing protein n=1 Tax=Flavobacterium sp. MFBS3-15 TaxID=2989816 RepID=UPI0022365B35|nr:T9SS type B sorting domain-containing protein [Flavobacterium sp. MFBS3-15]MCW4468478.1 T9SS type B sorting domain-containing protein [Flavobacterium sp. MFBS3-15]